MAITLKKTNPGTQQGAGVNFLKKGSAAQALLKKEEAKAELAKEEKGRLWRFFLKDGEERRITFIDGDLDGDGMLDILMFYEHTVFHNSRWTPFTCIQEDEPCPVCESGDRPSLVGVFTIIDHSQYEDKQGKMHKDERRLFVAKRNTIQQLQTLAGKRGGLAGCTFDVSRSGDKAPSVGSLFDFVEKRTKVDLTTLYGSGVFVPAEYEKEIIYRTAEQLAGLGVGKAVVGIGKEPPVDKAALEDQL